MADPEQMRDKARDLVNQMASAGAAEYADNPHVVCEFDPTTTQRLYYGPYPSVVEALAAVDKLLEQNKKAGMPEIVATAHPLFPPV